MKRIFIIALAALVFVGQNAFAWGRLGHEIVIKVAERHLTEKAKENIAKYMNYDLAKDAVWMDTHRNDADIAYTTSWHVYNVDKNHNYDPNPRLYKGDALLAIRNAEYNLLQYENQTDSTVVMNLRMMLHFVGDMHCPTHSYIPGPRCFWECTLNGKPQKTFHGVYDSMPAMLYGNDADPAEVAASLDNLKKREIKKIQKGSLYDWARDCGDNNAVIYEWNPFNTEVLHEDTVELSRELVNIQLRNAGYRLAYMLNKCFDPKYSKKSINF